ncbi:ABC transporter ATP-binding protein [Actinomadura soli]|uniref:ABC transporter ATP-binding protein n=1 Tax=Actinomadura soli TaxID=2508997 RepID=UPI00197AE91C|nr:ABC transporter ATP-binding protein [Actinomadura soli]
MPTEITTDPAEPAPGVAAACAAHGLTRGYRNAGRLAVDGVSFSARHGEVFGVLGRNGAGKTTLLRMLVGLLRPAGGTVRIRGAEVTGQAARAAAHVAYLPQSESALTDMSVRTAVEATARLRGLSRAHARRQSGALLAELGLEDLADARMERLSGGQRRLAGVATALAGQRPLLVLDEPTTGLDLDSRRTVWRALDRRRADGTAIVLVTHNVLEAESVLDRVLVLHQGRTVACDTPARLKERFGGLVRLQLSWRHTPPLTPADLGGDVRDHENRWSVRLPVEDARRTLTEILSGPAYTALDDFSLTPPSLEDVLLSCDTGEEAR